MVHDRIPNTIDRWQGGGGGGGGGGVGVRQGSRFGGLLIA